MSKSSIAKEDKEVKSLLATGRFLSWIWSHATRYSQEAICIANDSEEKSIIYDVVVFRTTELILKNLIRYPLFLVM